MNRQILAPGQWVCLPAQPDWGVGQVQSVVGDRVTVGFAERGKVVLNTAHAALRVLAEEHDPPRPERQKGQ